MPTDTTRGFTKPLRADSPPNIEAAVGDLADDINAKVAKFLYGPEGSLPAYAATYEGTFYHCTDTKNLFFGDNTGWQLIKGTKTLAHVTIPTTISITATTEAAPTTIIDYGAITFNGSQKIKIEFWAPLVEMVTGGGGATPQLNFSLWDGGTDLGVVGRINIAAYIVSAPLKIEVQEFTPTSGSHNYKIRAYNYGGGGSTADIAGGAAFPAGPGAFNRAFGRVISV